MKKINLLILLVLVLILVQAQNILAVGASPARVNVPHNPEGIDMVIPYTVRNNALKDVNINITVEGPLKEYVTVSKNFLFLKQAASASFELHLKIPKDVSFIGPQKVLIFITEEAVEGQGVGAKTGVVPDIIVNYPYPGKYLEIQGFNVENINVGEPTNVEWVVVSRGSETTSFYGTLSIYDEEGAKKFSREYPTKTLNPGEQFSLKEQVPTENFDAGTYNGTIDVYFDTMQASSYDTFRVGTEDLNLLWYTTNLTIGTVSPFKVGIENLWNGKFDVYARINFQGITATTPTLKIDPFGVLVLEQYVNPGTLEVGKYDGTIELYFGENSKQFPMTVEIMNPPKEGLDFEGLLLPIAIALVALVIILVLVLFLKKKKK